MRKIFIRYFLLVMVITVVLTVVGNSVIQSVFAEHAATKSGETMITEIADRINNNNQTIKELKENLNENYITRAKAFAEIIVQNPDMIYDFDEMVRMTKVLNVAEVHVTDENGILLWGNIPEYYGLDFSATDQTRPFLPGLTDKSFEMAQEPQLNGSIGKLFQYISVARQDKPGIVQVGVEPEVLDRALANNKIDVVISNFNVSSGEKVIAFDKNTGTIVADTKGDYLGKSYHDIGIPEPFFNLENESGWLRLDDQQVYAVFGEYDDYIIAVSFSDENLYHERQNQNVVAVVSSTLLGLIIIVSIFILLKRIIIQDIELVNKDLKEITHGDLEVVVNAKATPELGILSEGINEMVESLKSHMAEISSQAAELEERNKNILSSLSYARRIQNNLLPDPKAFSDAFEDFSVLWEPKDTVGGDIYWIKNFSEGAVLCVCDCTGHGTPGALLTMLVVTALESLVNEHNCKEPRMIMWELNEKLVTTLSSTDAVADIRDGADLAILYVSKSGDITMSAANTHLFICDGETVENIKGQKLSLGEDHIPSWEKIRTVTIPSNPGNKYFVASDGLFDQIGGKDSMPFGYRRFKSIILENYPLTQQEIIRKIWEEFQIYMGIENRRDDITLLGFNL